MKQTLGLFIGTESIGWSLVRDSSHSEIIDMGTRVFSSFVNHIGEGEREISNATIRTQARNDRKIYLRKIYRKRQVLTFLAANGLCPLKSKDLIKWYKDKKPTIRTQIMDVWFALDPYEFRAKGLQGKISKFELGRILYHMTQRRGKIMSDIENKTKAKALLEGLPIANRLGIHHTYDHLDNKHLGAYLNTIKPKKNKPFVYGNTRIRNRYLDRKMFINELHALLNEQQKYHKVLTEEFRHTLMGDDYRSGLLFFQRPAQYKRQGGGNMSCRYEAQKKAMLKSHPLQEWHDIYLWVNSIRYNGHKLTTEQRDKALSIALKFSSFMFKKVRIALGVDDADAFNYEDSTKLFLSHTLVQLSRIQAFGNRFFEFTQEEQHDLWHDLHFYTDKNKLKERLISKWGLSNINASSVIRLKLKSGYGSLSMKAGRAILPFLIAGHQTRTAAVLGSVKNAIGIENWRQMPQKKVEAIIYFVECAVKDNYIDDSKWIADFHDAFSIKLPHDKLYIAQQQEGVETLPVSAEENSLIQREYKPIVQKPIFELRKIVNKLIQQYGPIDEINFVLSNQLKTNAKNRKAIYIDKKIREQQLPKIHKAVIEAGQNPTHSNLLKYKLWLEWSKTCPYTNTPISEEMLFSEEVAIIYILPWKRFFNDSDKNKTICIRSFVNEIRNKTPYEYFKEQPSGTWEKLKTRVLEQLMNGTSKHYAYQKYKHFIMSIYAEDVVNKEFNDQHHLAIKVKYFLSQVAPKVVAARGNSIGSLRRKWGIKSLGAYENKPRHYNSREPALNALVTALNAPKYLEELRHWNRYEPDVYREVFPTPWKRFTHDVSNYYNRIAVSIDAENKVVRLLKNKKSGAICLSPKGKLHKDSFYSKRLGPDGNEAFHIRKPIKSLTTAKQVSKIVDHSVKELIYDHIDLYGGFENGKIPRNALTTLTDTGWETNIFLPNRNGDKVPVRKVRIRENVSNAVQLSEGMNKYVNPRNNHHVLIYKTLDGQFKEHIVSFWEAVKRLRNQDPVYQLPSDGRSVVTTLHINDCFILGLSNDKIKEYLDTGVSLWDHVYRIQRISSRYYEFRHIYDLDVYDQTHPNYVRILNFGDKKTGWLTHNPFKILISLLGKITPIFNPLKVPEMQ
jgi:CRISPR-associated endonuclease Csn1